MVSQTAIRNVCGNSIYNNIPHESIDIFNITHNRYYDELGNTLPKGGHTVCCVKVNGTEFLGLAYCSRYDNFSKKAGRKIAMKRAWEHYWAFTKHGVSV